MMFINCAEKYIKVGDMNFIGLKVCYLKNVKIQTMKYAEKMQNGQMANILSDGSLTGRKNWKETYANWKETYEHDETPEIKVI